MDCKKKEACRELSNVLSTYHLPLGALSYADYVGLVLNLDRVWLIGAINAARGTALASGTDDLDRVWADALAVDPAEVDEILFQANKARMEARIAARRANEPPATMGGMG